MFLRGLDRLIGCVVAAAKWLALPLITLLFLQWPLRELFRGYSREANDLGQVAFCAVRRRLGLAPAMINELFDVLADLRDEGITILLVDQMAVLALAVADRGYVIDSGQIVREDSAANLASDPEVEAAYLGHVEAAQ
jgi:uncharacterized membrane protein YccC